MQIKTGEIVEGKITGLTKYGAFVSINGESGASETTGMIHISEISGGFVKDINECLEVGQTIKAVVLSVNESGKLALSVKRLPQEKEKTFGGGSIPPSYNSGNFEDMMNKFKRDSDEKISDLKQKHLEPKRNAPRRRKD